MREEDINLNQELSDETLHSVAGGYDDMPEGTHTFPCPKCGGKITVFGYSDVLGDDCPYCGTPL